MKIAIIDNYDSFTYNLVYLFRQADITYDVFRNDKITGPQLDGYDGLLLSPGPGIPEEAGQLMNIIDYQIGKIPILGICLGHQALALHLGVSLRNMSHVFHGIQCELIQVHSSALFQHVPRQFEAGRYHSWTIEKENLTDQFNVTAIDLKGDIMAMENESKLIYGLQFHPESIMTPEGGQMINNFIEICKTNMS